MNWIQSLYETYEKCATVVGDKSDVSLEPIFHTFQQAHIEITLDRNGTIRHACVVAPDNCLTLIPCTEKSGSYRNKGFAPHPLCDKLQYVAKDYKTFVGDQDYYFESYKELLSAWVTSGAPEKVKAVHKYVLKGTVINDLVDAKVLFDDKGKLVAKRPIPKGSNSPLDIFDRLPGVLDPQTKKLKQWQGDAFVRWKVEIGDSPSEVWTDQEIMDSWVAYYTSAIKTKKVLCYITGREDFAAEYTGGKIRTNSDSAKLISSNDTSNFTFRGRFIDADECASVSAIATQKAHAALRWLIRRQGYILKDEGGNPGLTVVAWAVSGKKTPTPVVDTYAILYGSNPEGDSAYTAQDLATRLNKKIAGYKQTINATDDVVVMALDSLTKGRLFIVYYRALKGSDFLDRIESWHTMCAWKHTYLRVEKQDDKGEIRKVSAGFYGAPAPIDIAKAAYGSRLDTALQRATILRLLPCIVEGQPIPRDLVESVVRRASNRAGLSPYDWDKALTIACALYRKYQSDRHEKEVFDMGLDETRTTRDYLYGRLLAIADVLEENVMRKSGEKRATNATRYMHQFSQRPYQTWKQLHEALIPYMVRIGGAYYYKNLIADVTSLNPEALKDNSPLSGEYLIGYYCQRAKLRDRASEDESKESAESQENTAVSSNG